MVGSQYQERLVMTQQSIAENKQMEVVELKQKLEKMERQVHGQSEVKEIVAKIITITK